MSQSSQAGGPGPIADRLTDDVGRPIPEIVLPVVAVGAVLVLAWVWRRSAEGRP